MRISDWSSDVCSSDLGDPRAYGGSGGADLIAWLAAFVIADGKMRGLFTMLFGASMAIVADRAAARGGSPAAVHYPRMAWSSDERRVGEECVRMCRSRWSLCPDTYNT